MNGPETWDEATPDQIVEYVRGRLCAIEHDTELLKKQHAQRRHQIAGNIRTEVARIRWALGFLDGKGQDNKVLPNYYKFAVRVLGDWPDVGTLDGFDLQEHGEATGLLVPRVMAEPCVENCNCTEYYRDDEWPVTCYRLNLDGQVIDGRALKKHGGDQQ